MLEEYYLWTLRKACLSSCISIIQIQICEKDFLKKRHNTNTGSEHSGYDFINTGSGHSGYDFILGDLYYQFIGAGVPLKNRHIAIQSKLARALDQGKFAVVANIYLSSAFDLVNIKLLIKRMYIKAHKTNEKSIIS